MLKVMSDLDCFLKQSSHRPCCLLVQPNTSCEGGVKLLEPCRFASIMQTSSSGRRHSGCCPHSLQPGSKACLRCASTLRNSPRQASKVWEKKAPSQPFGNTEKQLMVLCSSSSRGRNSPITAPSRKQDALSGKQGSERAEAAQGT